FSSRRRHTRFSRDWSSDVCSSDLSVAVAWNIGREQFFQSLNVFDDLKLRASYGRLGNPASGGTSLARLGAGFTYLFGNSGNISKIGRASCRERVETPVVAAL